MLASAIPASLLTQSGSTTALWQLWKVVKVLTIMRMAKQRAADAAAENNVGPSVGNPEVR